MAAAAGSVNARPSSGLVLPAGNQAVHAAGAGWQDTENFHQAASEREGSPIRSAEVQRVIDEMWRQRDAGGYDGWQGSQAGSPAALVMPRNAEAEVGDGGTTFA